MAGLPANAAHVFSEGTKNDLALKALVDTSV
jgi:hypothetical protein